MTQVLIAFPFGLGTFIALGIMPGFQDYAAALPLLLADLSVIYAHNRWAERTDDDDFDDDLDIGGPAPFSAQERAEPLAQAA